MKKLFFLMLAVLLCLSCAPAEPTGNFEGRLLSVTDTAVTFSDDAGRTFTVAKKPQTTAVLFSSFAEMWRDAGGSIAVTVGESITRGFADADTPLVDAGAGKQINAEVLVSYAPQLVLCTSDIPAQVQTAALLTSADIAAACFSVECFSDYLRVYEIFCALQDNRAAFDAAAAQGEQIDALLSALPQTEVPPRILFLRAGTSARATKAKRAEDHFAAGMLAALGCENIADAAPVLLDGISQEAVLAQNPDAIFVSLMGEEAAARAYFETMLAGEAWQSLDAVREGRVYLLPKALFHHKPNGRWYEAYAFLYEVLYSAS